MRTIVWASVRRRTGPLIALALLTAISVGVSLAVAASARRTASSLDRALERAQVADVSVDVAIADPAHARAVAKLPEVAASSSYVFTAVRPAGTELVGGVNLTGITPLDDVALNVMDQPRLVDGRMPRPDRADEVALSTWLAGQLDVVVGDAVTFEAYRQSQVEAIFEGTGEVAPAGARIAATVVGVGDPLDALGGESGGFGIVAFSHAAWTEYGGGDLDFSAPADSDVGVFRLLLRARLHGGADDEAAYLRGLEGIYGDAIDTTFSEDRPDVFGAVSDTVHVASVALALTAIAALLAGMVLTTQALTREVRGAAAAAGHALRSIGLTRAQRALASAGPGLLAVAAGVVVGVVGAVAASSWVPPGVARFLDPDPGRRVDAAAHVGGALGFLVVLSVVLAIAGWRAAGRAADRTVRPRRWSSLRGGSGLALAVRMGQGRQAGGVPLRPATVAAAGGVAGVIAALVFAASLHNLTDSPALWGAPWDAQILLQSDGAEISEREAPSLASDEQISRLSRFQVFETSLDGSDTLTRGLALERLRGDLGPTVLHGRLPVSADEIAVNADAVAGKHRHLGDVVEVGDPAAPSPKRVVGLLGVNGVGQFVVTADGTAELAPEFSDAGFLLTWADGVDGDAAMARLGKRFTQIDRPEAPGPVVNLDRVRSYPNALGAFLAVLALASLAHLCATTARRARHDLSVARALGCTGAQVRRALFGQATLVVIVGLLVGVPAGIIAGRAAWAAVARSVQVVDVATLPLLGLVAAGAGAVVLGLVIAAGPALGAARRQPADDLRTG
jgi:ABC-type lipoprotein release transport system permease subunit